MRSLSLTLRSGAAGPDAAYRRICEFERYPDFVDEVRSVVVKERTGDTLLSEWEIDFRNGPLRWTEADYLRPAQRRIVFEQTSGDFETFRGAWSIEPSGDGCSVTFEATFDFGIPSLAGVLEPIAAKVLKEGIAVIVHQLLGSASVVDDPATDAAMRVRVLHQSRPAVQLPA
ncbi:MAG: hypothetical protein AVDCRST_MAG66-4400 [uncultured Pseudonocardia sp.]|uniref:Coenzyme Q-binding protein COQ10 START domain-containing protein n=1 Tax=uncultured Pseudonocardia sp. TaxID=211455 RepID=A0A6J4QET9_9PSEU|nr:MAG: hypothetical protein AVDCRST_MAG66-4400 [uncultured Pseudonocardia sp.]